MKYFLIYGKNILIKAPGDCDFPVYAYDPYEAHDWIDWDMWPGSSAWTDAEEIAEQEALEWIAQKENATF